MGRGKTEIVSFYCPKCGQESMPLARKTSLKHERFHRKELYCWHCKVTLNCIEIKNQNELFQFKEDFNSGKFIKEVEESIAYTQSKVEV